MACHVKVIPVRIREHDPVIGCDRLRGIGFRAVCDCGTIGKVRRSRAVALADAREHAPLTAAPSPGTAASS